jgi:hypothetical protein
MASTAHQNQLLIETNVSARLPHVALANQVELQGTDAARALYEAARLYNGEHFEGALLPCFVEITPPGSMRALADYRPRSHEGVDSHIRIGVRTLEKGGRYALDVLLHEMVHAFCFEILGDIEPGYAGHGPKWTAQCNRIGRKLGLGEVFTKGRGGPSSARWPMSVRPAGYYGEPEETGPSEPAKPRKEREAAQKAPPLDQIVSLLGQLSRGELDTLQAVVDAMCEEREASN